MTMPERRSRRPLFSRMADENTPMMQVASASSWHVRPVARWTWLLTILAAFAIVPALTRNIAALAYDAGTEHVYRGVVFSQAISDGVLYPRWVQFLHWGLGSPLFTFQPPLPYYGMDLLYRLDVPHPIGWRILIAGGLLAAFYGMYLLMRAMTGKPWPAVVAGVRVPVRALRPTEFAGARIQRSLQHVPLPLGALGADPTRSPAHGGSFPGRDVSLGRMHWLTRAWSPHARAVRRRGGAGRGLAL